MPAKKQTLLKTPPALSPVLSDAALIADIRQIILDARQQVARAVDSGLVLMNWAIGTRIRRDILKEQRAEYGKQIVSALGRQLSQEFGRGYGPRNIANMIRFAEVLPDPGILQSLIAKLSWTHFLHIILPKAQLQQKLHEAVTRARARIEQSSSTTPKSL